MNLNDPQVVLIAVIGGILALCLGYHCINSFCKTATEKCWEVICCK
jgi:hypothetical protein